MKEQKLFNHMRDAHDLILLESEMEEIIKIVKEIIFEAQVETPSVSDNETKKKLCEYYPDKCDYDKDFDCPYMDDEDILCYEQ
jgi:hypothetical protein